MKLTIEGAALLRAINAASAVVERRATIPILMNVMIEAAGDEARIVASDLEIQIGVKVKAQVATPGAITVGAQLLQSIARELDEGAQIGFGLTGSDEGQRLQLTSGRSRYRLPTLPASDFPLVKGVGGGVSWRMGCSNLAAMLKSIAYAQSSEETRYYLMGVCIDVRDERLALAATNGHVLAAAQCPAPDGSELLERPIIIHRKLIGELIKLLDGADGEIDIATDHQRVSLRIGDVDIVSKLIDGEYPDWRRHIPQDHPHRLKVRRAGLVAAVRRAVVVAEDKTRSVRVDFKPDVTLVSSRGSLSGTAEEEVPCGYDGSEFPLGLNSRYVLDTLDAIGADDIEIALLEPTGPNIPATVFTSPARPDGQWLLMPMRV